MKRAGGPTQIQSIQWLRALAALAVVAFHASLQLGDAFIVGAAGVDVFFVISGFIMWSISARESRPAAFMVNRIVRITPLYWLATGVMIFGALAGLFPRVVLTPDHIVNSLLFIPHVSPSNHQVWPLLVQGWTLNYEMFFYALFALTLFAPRALQAWLLCAIFSVLAGAGLLLKPDGVAAFYTDTIILEFAAGVLLAKLFAANLRIGRVSALALAAAGVAGFVIAHFEGDMGPRALVYGVPALLLVAGVVGLERAGVSFHWRPATFVGDASYAIYLFHTFAISVLAKLVDFNAQPVLGVALSFAGAVLVGAGAHILLERPVAALLRPQRRHAYMAWVRGLLAPTRTSK